MEDLKFTKNSKEEMRHPLQGYADYFLDFYYLLMWNGIDSVRNYFIKNKKSKVDTVKEYLEKHRIENGGTISAEKKKILTSSKKQKI